MLIGDLPIGAVPIASGADAVGIGVPLGSTYTASAPLVIGAAITSGSAQHTQPSYTGAGAVTTGAAILAGLVEFNPPVYSATAALIAGKATASGVAEYDAPVYAGTAALLSPIAILSASGETSEPTYTASAVLTVAATTFYAWAPEARGIVFIAVYDGYNPVTMMVTGYAPIIVTAAESMPAVAVVSSMPRAMATGRTPEASAEIY